MTERRAADLVADLERHRDDAERAKIGRRVAAGEPVIGVRMRTLFDLSEEYTDLAEDGLRELLDHPAYEPRLAAFCILDFKARRRIDDDERRHWHDLYLERHDAITVWDMVDRAAPRVVGGHLIGRDTAVLKELVRSAEPLRRRTALTAPLMFVRAGSDDDVAAGLRVAAYAADDPDPVVHKPVGIYLKYVGRRDAEAAIAFLDDHAARLPAAALRMAVEKLPPDVRRRYAR